MTESISFYPFWSLLFLIIAVFYLFRLVGGRRQIRHFDAENEVGHGMMALGMAFMLAPAGSLPSGLLLWNIILFAVASLWWAFRLCVQKPVFAFLLGQNEPPTPRQSDAFHAFMHGGMCYMFLLVSSMALSMTPLANIFTSLFTLFFAFLTCFYGREIARDLQTAKRDWLQFGANLAHALMGGVMCWMFLEMLMMTMSMNAS